MNTELSPRVRTIVSSLAAVAITGLLMSTLIESLNPAALTRRGVEPSTPVAAAATSDNATFIRRV